MQHPFLVALAFLTTCPVYLPAPPTAAEEGASLNWYGVVGLGLGLVLAALALVLGDLSPGLAAALVLVAWVLATGALHLDGLGDSADGLFAASREQAFAIMRDSRAGAMAVTAIVLLLVVKYAALVSILAAGDGWALVAAPLAARAGVQALFLTTPYARADGIGADMAMHLDRQRLLVAIVIALVLVALCMGASAWFALPLLAVVFWWLRRMMMRRLLGTTGDSAGALVEILEAAVLVLLS